MPETSESIPRTEVLAERDPRHHKARCGPGERPDDLLVDDLRALHRADMRYPRYRD